MSKKKETFAPVHMKDLSPEEQEHAEKLLRGEPSLYELGKTKEDLDRRIKSLVKDISNEIIVDIAPFIRILQYNAKEIVKVKNKTEKRLSRLPKKLLKLMTAEGY